MDILSHPDPALRSRAEPVDPSADATLRPLAVQMLHAMREAPGVGLAATQVGVQKRLIVFDLEEEPVAVCNPEIVERSDETDLDEEGCLSLPGITVPIERSVRVVCTGLDLSGAPVRIEASDLLARLLQHETDHLDGVLILDRAAPEERRAAIRRYNEVRSQAG